MEDGRERKEEEGGRTFCETASVPLPSASRSISSSAQVEFEFLLDVGGKNRTELNRLGLKLLSWLGNFGGRIMACHHSRTQ